MGLIAGLTVPSIVNSVDRSQNRAILKESVQIISAITQAGVLNGDFAGITDWNLKTSTDPNGIVGYIGSKLNYAKQCLATDTTSDGCKLGWAETPATSDYNAHNARWILPNGAKLQNYCASSAPYYWNATNMLWTVTTKAYANKMNPWATFPDTIVINCNITETTQTIFGTTLKAGTCGPYGSGFWEQQLNIALGNT